MAITNLQKSRVFVGFYSDLILSGNFQNKQKLYDIELVKFDLMNQFYTRKGERVMWPNFGSAIWDYIFEPYNDTTINLITQDVQNVVNSDSRVQLLNLNVQTYDTGVVIQVELFYNQFQTAETFELTFDQQAANRT
jgi:phage baseplate assembly protein W